MNPYKTPKELAETFPMEYPLLDLKPVPTHIHTSWANNSLRLFIFDGKVVPQRGVIVFAPPRIFGQNWDTGGSYFEPERIYV